MGQVVPREVCEGRAGSAVLQGIARMPTAIILFFALPAWNDAQGGYGGGLHASVDVDFEHNAFAKCNAARAASCDETSWFIVRLKRLMQPFRPAAIRIRARVADECGVVGMRLLHGRY